MKEQVDLVLTLHSEMAGTCGVTELKGRVTSRKVGRLHPGLAPHLPTREAPH